MDWIDSGCEDDQPDLDEDENNEVMVIQDGCVYMFNSSGLHQKYGHVKWAIGSGGSYAIGAMEAGATSVEAVEIAINLDIFSGYGIDFLPWEE